MRNGALASRGRKAGGNLSKRGTADWGSGRRRACEYDEGAGTVRAAVAVALERAPPSASRAERAADPISHFLIYDERLQGMSETTVETERAG